MDDWLGAWKVDELYREAQAHRIPFAPINSMRQMYDNEHFCEPASSSSTSTSRASGACSCRARRRSTARSSGRCGDRRRASGSTRRGGRAGPVGRPAPHRRPYRRGRHARAARPLEGIRVLDFTAGLGRPVLHPEPGPPRRRGDPRRDDGAHAVRHPADPAVRRRRARTRSRRLLQPVQPGQAQHPARPAPAARPSSSAYDLVEHCDVVTDNFSAGVIEKLGLGYDKLRADQARHHPDLHVGLRPDRPVPLVPRLRTAGVGAVRAVRPHRLRRRRAGRDRRLVPRSQRRAHGGLRRHGRAPASGPHRRGSVHRSVPVGGDPRPHGRRTPRLGHASSGSRRATATTIASWRPTRPTRRSATTTSGSRSPSPPSEEWRALCQAMGQPALADDARFARAELRKQNEAALDEIITAWTSARDRWDAAETSQHAGVAAFPSMSNKDLAEDAHLTERGYLVQLEHPVVGRRIHAGIPWRMSGDAVRRPARRPVARRRCRRGLPAAPRPLTR